MDFPIHYPASIDVLVYITDGANQQGTATVSFKPGKEITKQDVRDAVAALERDSMPEGFRLMTKREVWNWICEDMAGRGARFAMPGGEDFDD
ncbi:hypothetical protein D3C87_898110 [compost metagenome]|uniref:hypothetical protein n=1 Tax=Achromobacter TaxID=222 RepID=UPI00062A43DC|nr:MULTISPECIES: hypothetical protein [Achromobacter]TRM53242.1 hypothetical protein YH64_009075 [Achromobacter sp. LC458]WLW59855.1 hypothetical protein RA224_21810 [Achromobacter aegrifaciens]